MSRRFDLFVIFAEMRTGSNLLEASLNGVPGLTCHGEAFNPHFIGYPKAETMLGVTLAERAEDPGALLAAMRAAPGLNGFRFFHDHDPRVLDDVLDDPRCAKVILTRNPVESYVSLKIARQTGQWKLGDARHQKTSQVLFEAEEFTDHLAGLQAFQVQLQRALQLGGQTAFYVDYEDIQDVAVLNGLGRFLGAEGGVPGLATSLVKQNPEPLDSKVANFGAMEAALARLDRFNLTRTPNFEPRRGPAVPSFVAAARAPLLFMPVKAGPVAQVLGWLAALDEDGALQAEFTRKSLRQWLRAHPLHRSFTVLRHPVRRAHEAFCTCILNGRYTDLREVLRKTYKLPLPPVARVAQMDLAAHRAAFAAFARFLKGHLAGQTSVRIDAAWASQAAVLQGFAQFALPDIIMREDRLAEDLAHLAASVGRPAPALPAAEPEPAPFALAEVMTGEIEALLREAYQRDYIAFGFGDWQPSLAVT
ncbi:MAG: nodulation protein NodH [Defluviimonas sp.]|nr:nodulation protein NodH [Defluviimonas sp.]